MNQILTLQNAKAILVVFRSLFADVTHMTTSTDNTMNGSLKGMPRDPQAIVLELCALSLCHGVSIIR